MTKQQDNVFEFFKLLIEFGGVHYVNEDKYVCNTSNDEPVLININSKGMPLMVFHESMPAGEYAVFNPLIEPLGSSAELAWFHKRNSLILGVMVKAMIRKAAEAALSTDKDYEKLEFIEPWFKSFDKKFLSELDKINATKFCRLYYHKKSKTAQLQTDLFDDETFTDVMKTFRKRSRDTIREMFTMFFGTDDVPSKYKHIAQNVAFLQADASIHVFVQAGEALSKYVRMLLGKSLNITKLKKHLGHIDEYHKKCMWYSPPSSNEEQKAQSMPSQPWESKLKVGKPLPGTGSKLPKITRCAGSLAFQQPSGMVPSQPMTGQLPMMGHQPSYQRTATGLPINTHAPGTSSFQSGMGNMRPPLTGYSQGTMNAINSPYAPPLGGPSYGGGLSQPNLLTPGCTTPDAAKLPPPRI